MSMKNPCHPGEIVRAECLAPLGLTVTAAAEVLGVTRKTLSELLNGHSGVSAEMAVRLEKAFGGTARVWLDLQTAYDLSRVDPARINVKRFVPKARNGAKAP